MKDIPLNARVTCLDGEGGRSSHVIINSLNRAITHVVVENDNLRDSKQRLVPFKEIVETTHRSIRLKCTVKELAAMEKFTQTRFVDVDEAEYSSFGSTEYIFDEMDIYAIPSIYSEPSFCSVAVEEKRILAEEITVGRGARVKAIDGHIGRVDEFVIDPKDGCVTHLVVREGHLWNKKEVTLPLSTVDCLDEHVVELKLNKKTIKSLPAVPLKRFYSLKS